MCTQPTVAGIDPTSYYPDFWNYASLYGEEAARLYYTVWSPPVGTMPPPGIVIPSVPATANAYDSYAPTSVSETGYAAAHLPYGTTEYLTEQGHAAGTDGQKPYDAASAAEVLFETMNCMCSENIIVI